jgi:hypothetical protein
MAMSWSEEELDAFEDPVLKAQIRVYTTDFEEEWRILLPIMRQHADLFVGIDDPAQTEDLKQMYLSAFCSVVTRCFGWGLPCTTMVPFADFINHHNVDSSYEMVSSECNPRDPNSGLAPEYYCNSKQECDYSYLFASETQ